MKKVILIRYSEISLKGENRGVFENILVKNIKGALEYNKIQYEKVVKTRGRIILFTDNKCLFLKKVFGIHSFSRALMSLPELDEMKVIVDEILSDGNKSFDSFRISTQRIDKTLKLKSMEVDRDVGAYVADNYGKKVSLKEFDLNIGIELIDNTAYLFTDTLQGGSGLPVGSGPKAYVWMNHENYELATWHMMKRGCDVVFFGSSRPKFDFLDSWLFGNLEVLECNSLHQLGTMFDGNTIAVVSGLDAIKYMDFYKTHLDETLEKGTKSNIAFLTPLVGMTKQDIEKKIHSIKEV